MSPYLLRLLGHALYHLGSVLLLLASWSAETAARLLRFGTICRWGLDARICKRCNVWPALPDGTCQNCEQVARARR